ncbi:MAG: S9 family peptidase [Bryobacterales bacterium]|nr:S9 family peptidase [Bryobacterales bacterium]
MITRRFLFVAFFTVCVTASGERWSVEQVARLTRVSDPQIAPDGKSLIVVRSKANFEDNRYDPQLVQLPVSGGGERVLVRDRRGLGSARWSSDGKHIAFLAQAEGKSQVFVMPVDGGESWQLTKAPMGVQQFSWSPDASVVAYVTADEPAKRAGVDRHLKAFTVGHNHFLMQEGVTSSHLWLIKVAPGEKAKRLTEGSWSLPVTMPPSSPASPPAWSPDGKQIAIVKLATPYTGDSDQAAIQIIDVASGAMRPLTGRSKNESQPSFSPDGRFVAYWSPRDGESKNVNEVYVTAASGGEGRSVTRGLDRNVMRAIWSPDGKSLLVSANDGTGVSMWMQPLEGPARRIDTGKIVATAPFWLDASMNNRGQVVFTGSEPLRPAEVYYLPAADAKPQRLTDWNGFATALELGKTESIVWNGADGLKQDGVVTYPPDFVSNRKWPLLLYIHGGPRSASKEAFASGRAQLFAAQGWVVFEPNYRGSDNLGNAFQSAIWNDAGAGPGRDVMSGVDLLKKRGWVDEAKMAVSGWSYGGYMTSWLIGNYPDVWRVAVAGAAVTDLLDQYHLGDSNVRRGSAWGGSPWTDPKRMQAAMEQSPMHYAARIKTPTLIMALTGDYRVTVTQSYKLYHALRDNNVPVEFIAYPLPGHSPTDPVHSRDVDQRWIAWLKKYLDGGASGGN